MAENIKLYDRDYTEVLLETGSREAATDFLRASGKEWLPMTISYGTGWQHRWSGRLEMTPGGGVAAGHDIQYLEYLRPGPSTHISAHKPLF